MYSVTTDTGLAFETTNPIDLGEALYVELTAHGAAQAISYSITHDGAPQHDGTIDVHSTDHDSAGFLRDSVQEVVNDMIIQAAYAAHALAKSS